MHMIMECGLFVVKDVPCVGMWHHGSSVRHVSPLMSESDLGFSELQESKE